MRTASGLFALLAWLANASGQPLPPQATGPAAEALIGVWSSELVLNPVIGGELLVDGRGSPWVGSIAGYTVPVERSTNGCRFTLPGELGEFRGSASNDKTAIVGQWIQCGGDYPYNARYATPVELGLVSPGIWRGNVAPLEPRIAFYLVVRRSPTGKVTAFVRNPEANRFGRFAYEVELSGGAVRLVREGQQLEGKLDAERQELSLSLLGARAALVFRRTEVDKLMGFQARVPEDHPYVYRPPVPEDDGWKTGTLAEVGLDPKPIADFVNAILTADPAENPLYIHSLLIARHGKLVLEEYFYGFHKDRPHDMRSASKTFTPMLVGIARDRGLKIGADTTVVSLFPEYRPLANPDRRKDRLKIRDLITMTSGLACNDNDPATPGSEDRMQEQEAQPDWYKFTLDLPMVAEPGGEHAVYCSAGMNLVGGAVQKATGRWLPEVFYDFIAKPLEFRTYHMNLTPSGDAYAGGGLYLGPRDELKLGQVYLNGGVWNGKRVVSQAWVQESIAVHSEYAFNPRLAIDRGHRYGYGWHLHDLEVNGHSYRDIYAGGNGGQNVIIIPELDMVIGINGGSYSDAAHFFRWELEFVPRYIIPAVIGSSGRD